MNKQLKNKLESAALLLLIPAVGLFSLLAIFRWEWEELKRCTRMNMIGKFARKCQQTSSSCKRGIVITAVIFCVLCVGNAHGETTIIASTVRDTVGCERTVIYTFHMNQAWHWHWVSK
jgi:hypothetical protein